MKNNFNKAFTLVELIVVITILAVLATVAFISFQGYSTESRDTKRKTDLATISKWLQVYLAANSLVPEPSETKTTITFSGSELLTQWYAGQSVLNTLRVQEAQDPIDETFYTYSINANNTKFQLVGFLENTQTANNFLENKLFADNSNRNIYTIWESVWILFDETNTPIQELWNTTVELENNATEYKTVLNKQNIISESGSILKTQILWAQKNLYGWRAFDPNCPIDDIQIWDQIWAGCNSTLGNGIEWWQTDSDIGNGTYSSTSIACHDYDSSSPTAIYKYCSAWRDTMMSYANPRSYFADVQPDNANSTWDKEVDTIWWKFYMWEDATSACPVWWHLPSLSDWENSLQVLNDGVACGSWGAANICSWQWWGWHSAKNNTNNIVNKLSIPVAWFRHDNRVRFDQRWTLGYIWTAFGENPDPYRLRFTTADSLINVNLNNQDYAFSVRCIKK